MSRLIVHPVAFTFFNGRNDWQGGINYFRSLFRALHATPDVAVRPVAFIGRRADVTSYQFPPNVQVIRSSAMDHRGAGWLLDKLGKKTLGVRLASNSAIRHAGISLLSHSEPTGQRSLRNIAWIPDFQHVYLPQFFSPGELDYRNKQFRANIENSDAVIVSSESARRDLGAFSPTFLYKARVLRFCAIPPDEEGSAPLDLHATYGLHGRFFYLPNQAWAHKNHLTAIRALARLQDQPDVRIVCSGSLHDYRNPRHIDTLNTEIERFGLADRFRLLGVVPYAHIRQLMLQATAVINPSLFEGWSTTVEEAKAIAVPLILSDIGVHREQCQNGEAQFFSPLAADQLEECMRNALATPPREWTPVERLRAREHHRARMTTFAREYAAIVEETLSGRIEQSRGDFPTR